MITDQQHVLPIPIPVPLSTDGWIYSRLNYTKVKHQVAAIWRKNPDHLVCTLYNPQTNSVHVVHGHRIEPQESDMYLVSETFERDIPEDLNDVPYQMLWDLTRQIRDLTRQVRASSGY